MTIARRLTILLTIPLIALVALVIVGMCQFARIESRSRFVDLQVESAATLGNLMRCFAEGRVSIRNYLLTQDRTEEAQAEARLLESHAESGRLLARYASTLISTDEDRRLLSLYQDLNRQWFAEAEKLVSITSEGRRADAIDRMRAGTFSDLGLRTTNVFEEWLQYNEELGRTAGQTTLTAIRD
jgi:CHASE3 domain sensor protein